MNPIQLRAAFAFEFMGLVSRLERDARGSGAGLLVGLISTLQNLWSTLITQGFTCELLVSQSRSSLEFDAYIGMKATSMKVAQGCPGLSSFGLS